MANRTQQVIRDRGPQQSHVQQRCMPNGKQDTTCVRDGRQQP
jgi:hypothetical protein